MVKYNLLLKCEVVDTMVKYNLLLKGEVVDTFDLLSEAATYISNHPYESYVIEECEVDEVKKKKVWYQ